MQFTISSLDDRLLRLLALWIHSTICITTAGLGLASNCRVGIGAVVIEGELGYAMAGHCTLGFLVTCIRIAQDPCCIALLEMGGDSSIDDTVQFYDGVFCTWHVHSQTMSQPESLSNPSVRPDFASRYHLGRGYEDAKHTTRSRCLQLPYTSQ